MTLCKERDLTAFFIRLQQVEVSADNELYTRTLRGLIRLNKTKEVGPVSQGHRGHTLRCDRLHKRTDPD